MDFDKYVFTPQNWEALLSIDVSATQVGTAYQPIPDQPSNIIFDNKLIIIAVDHGGVQASWKWGGQVHQVVNLGLSNNGSFNGSLKVQNLYLNRWNIFKVDQAVPDYSLKFTVPKWFPRWICTIYGYTGPITNDLDQALQDIKNASLT